MVEFGSLNWSILVIYVLANLLLGYILGKKINTDNDFYLGTKTTPWWAIGISVIATYVSALTFLGAPAWSYQEGLSVIAIHLNYPLVILVVVTLFFPFFYNSGVASIYEYIERRFGKKSACGGFTDFYYLANLNGRRDPVCDGTCVELHHRYGC